MKKTTARVAKGNWKHVDGGMAFVIPVTLLKHTNWIRLGPHSIKLIMDLARQYSGMNNGYLCPAWEAMKKCGWRSRETLYIAIQEAEHYGVIQKTLQGGRNRANRYAFTWWPINDLNGLFSLDVGPTSSPSNAWKNERAEFVLPEWLQRSRKKRNQKSQLLYGQRATTSHDSLA